MAGIVVAWGLMLAPPAMAQQGDDADALNAQVIKLYGEGKYAEALPFAERAVQAAAQQHGPDDLAVAGPLLMLGEVLGGIGRVPDAEPHERRALAIREKSLEPNHPDTAEALAALGGTFAQTTRPAEAEDFYKRALKIYETAYSPEHAEVGKVLGYLANLYSNQGRYANAEQITVPPAFCRRGLALSSVRTTRKIY
jgi:tetratricopeptide (TPR) repeat protein